MKRTWWQEAVIYQVYLRSFKDSNGDGIGDFKGLIEELDYLKDLGVDAVWVSPHYQSPMDDNGYDISDFYKVSEDYGNMEDVRLFIREAHKRDIKVLFDLVLNHTSDEHPWFLAAKDKNHPDHEKYHDYYIWHKPKYDEEGNKIMPTSWRSWFGGPVWEYNESTDEYYLHIFSKKMPDLNWRSEAMKKDLKEMTKWWIKEGVDGFRVDASNHLEKDWTFPDGHPGYQYFSSLPKHHEYLEELSKEIFKPMGVMTIGEAGGASKEEALKYCGFDSDEFDMLIHFGHTWADTDDQNFLTPGKWAKGQLRVRDIKESFAKWYKMLGDKGWNLIYWHNHDQPRILSHYGDDKQYRKESAKMLAYTLYYMPGTPIVYQGEEIGMTNVDYEQLDDFRDVEVYTEYENFRSFGASHEVAMQALRDRARDNARSPFQWSSEAYAGFSTGQPWMKVVGNYKDINLEKQMQDKDSVYHTYKSILHHRKEDDIAFGEIQFIDLESEDFYIYKNTTKTSTYLVIANFGKESKKLSLKEDLEGYQIIHQNYQDTEVKEDMVMRPYEALVLRKK
jgi:glycosidase